MQIGKILIIQIIYIYILYIIPLSFISSLMIRIIHVLSILKSVSNLQPAEICQPSNLGIIQNSMQLEEKFIHIPYCSLFTVFVLTIQILLNFEYYSKEHCTLAGKFFDKSVNILCYSNLAVWNLIKTNSVKIRCHL